MVSNSGAVSSVSAPKHYRRNAMQKLYPIKNYEETYAITKNGDVWSHRLNRFINRTVMKNGYEMVSLKRKKYYVHRLLAQTFISNTENKPQINHKNSNPLDNSLMNLEWCTVSENMQHLWDNNRGNRKIASDNGQRRRKVNDLQVRVIKRIKELNKYSNREIGIFFGYSKYLVQRLEKAVYYKNIYGELL